MKIGIELPNYYPAQKKIFGPENTAIITVVVAGSKAGKTWGATRHAVEYLINNPDSLIWWIALSKNQCRESIRVFRSFLPREIYSFSKTDFSAVLVNGATMQWLPGIVPDRLQGPGVNRLFIDEAPRVPQEAFASAMTTTTQTQGRVFVFGTPKRRAGKTGWYYNLYKTGLQRENWERVRSFHLSAEASPFVSKERLEELRRQLTKWEYDEQVLGKFTTGSSIVCFENYENCWGGDWEEPEDDEKYIMAVDAAVHHTYSVILVCRLHDHQIVYGRRFQPDSWRQMAKEIKKVSDKYNHAEIIYDATGAGEPGYEMLAEECNGECYLNKFTIKASGEDSRTELLNTLQVAHEEVWFTIPKPTDEEDDISTILIEEYENIHYKKTHREIPFMKQMEPMIL